MKKISECYEKCKSQRYSFTVEQHCRRIYLSEENNLRIDIREHNIFDCKIRLTGKGGFLFKRKKQ